MASIFMKKSTLPEARPKATSRLGSPISRLTGRRAQKPTPIRCAFAGLAPPHRRHGPTSVLHGCAYWIWWKLHAACPKRSQWRRTQFGTLRLNLTKLAATIVEKNTHIIVTPKPHF